MEKEKRLAIFVVIVVLALSFALAYTFEPTPCKSYECFQEHMGSCSSASYLNEEPEASWLYVINGERVGGCEIDVVLLQAKEGDLKLRGFEKHSMSCVYSPGVVAYPEKDMSVCHGQLKEDLQGVIIEKLHAYLVNNLIDVEKALGEVKVAT